MRVLQLAPIWETVPPPGYGGTEVVVNALTEELVRRGVEVTLCASGDSTTTARLFSVFPKSLRPAGLTEDALQYSLIHTVLSLKEAREGNYDLIHCHNGPPSELGMALSHLVDVPMLTTFHNQLIKSEEYIWSNYRGWYNTISLHQYRHLPQLPYARFGGVVPNAIEVDSFPFQAEKEDFLLFIGRIVPEKAPHLAVEVAKKTGMRLLIAGKIATEEEQAYHREVMAPLIDGDQIQFLGEADGAMKRDLYRRARALVLPLQWDEPFGLVMIEAMACGTPAIVFSRGAAPEIVLDGETGFLVHDTNEMVEAVLAADAISPVRCREHVEECFGPSALADNYLRVYERIITAERSGGAGNE